MAGAHAVLGWTSHGHVGGDVPLHAFGPRRPVGTFDGAQIGRILAEAAGLDLADATQRLFVEAGAALPGAQVEIDRAEVHNPLVRIRHNGTTAELPVNKNLLRLGAKTVELEGVVVHIQETGRTYLPEQAVRLIQGR